MATPNGKLIGAIVLSLIIGVTYILSDRGLVDIDAPSANADYGSKAGQFAYYSLVLSWSPTYCAQRTSNKFDRQCDARRPYAFVLHGAWPQHLTGWPEHCRVQNSWVPKKTVNSMLDIMPSKALIIHEWKKHGTCSGLSPDNYFKASRAMFKQIKIPPQFVLPTKPIHLSPAEVERAFLSANSHLSAAMISVSCNYRKRRLRDVRICFDRSFRPVDCGKNENQKRLCRQSRIVMPPVR